MREELEKLRRQALVELDQAARSEELLAVRTRYLGRKGLLTAFLRRLGEIKDEERPVLGKLTNDIKQELSARVEDALRRLSTEGRHGALLAEKIDVTLPGRGLKYGRLHPVTQTSREICDIFMALGFTIAEGPEVELDYYNFEALNIPKDHPARDMQDTLYVSDNVLLRTHTSPVQVRVMEKTPPPRAHHLSRQSLSP